MATAPQINVYEIIEGKPSVDRGKMFPSPDYFFALATAISSAEDVFLRMDDEILISAIRLYKKWKSSPPPEAEQAFEWFCRTCSDVARMTGDESWKAVPSDFSKGARALLAITFLLHEAIDEETANRLALFYKGFEAAIEFSIEDDKKPRTTLMSVVRVILFPIRPLLRRIAPPYYRAFDEELGEKARTALSRVIKLLKFAGLDGRQFTFDAPEDQIEKSLDLGGLNIAVGKDGSITMT